MVLAYYVHNLSRFLWQYNDSVGIRYYGLAYVLGFIAGGVLLYLYWKHGRSPLGPDAQADLLFWIMVGTMIGGRLGYYVFYAPDVLLSDPLELVRVWRGGMASHGGFIGVFFGTWWAARRLRVSLFVVGDLVVTLAPPGLMLGRIANFINGELWGKITDAPWAVIFPQSMPYESNPLFIPPRHPSQLYEAALEGLLLLAYSQWRVWKTPVLARAPGRLAGEFLLGYAIVRIIAEHFREPDPGIDVVLGLNRGAWLSLGLIVAGLALVVTASRRAKAATAQ